MGGGQAARQRPLHEPSEDRPGGGLVRRQAAQMDVRREGTVLQRRLPSRLRSKVEFPQSRSGTGTVANDATAMRGERAYAAGLSLLRADAQSLCWVPRGTG